MNKRIGLLAAAGAAALVLAGGTAYGAVSPSIPDSAGVIHGCYDSGGNLKVIDTSVTPTCPKGYSVLDWNQAGQTGPQGPAGPKGDTGAEGPTGPAGATGPAGPAGPAGANGTNGNTVLSGTGAPASTLGNDGDFYVDTAADVLYGPKAGGSWPGTGVSLVGPQGPAGTTGAQGPAGPTGPQGPAGATGPQGPAGPAGIAGGIETLDGTPCMNGQGTLVVREPSGFDTTNSATVTLECDSNNPTETISVHFEIGANAVGTIQVTSSPAGIDCTVSAQQAGNGTCSAQFPAGTEVTLTAALNGISTGSVAWLANCDTGDGTAVCTTREPLPVIGFGL